MTAVPIHNNDNASTNTCSPKTVGIAPMMEVTNREFRQLMRILSKHVTLWTEMVVDDTINYTNDIDQHLGYESNSHPIVCQIGGNNPTTISQACHKVIEYDYDEININMGCPSFRVGGERQFGAVLMKHVDKAEQVVQAMKEATSKSNTPISVKCRIGVDDLDGLEYMIAFIKRLRPYCRIFHLHARKCILNGIMTPKENRAIPPLNYPRVYALCDAFPDCDFYINGGISTLSMAKAICVTGSPAQNKLVHYESDHCHKVPCKICQFPNGSCVAPPRSSPPPNLKGCLLGRAARDNPCMLWDLDRYWYGAESNPCQNRQDVLDKYLAYIESVSPRRCCDSDPRGTRKLPFTPTSIEYDYCEYCLELNSDSNTQDHTKLRIAPTIESTRADKQTFKITTHLINRCIRPIVGILHGLPNSKTFRRECDRLIQHCPQYRNCGPANLIRRALRVVKVHYLQQPFEHTKDVLSDEDVINSGPKISSDVLDCCRGVKRW